MFYKIILTYDEKYIKNTLRKTAAIRFAWKIYGIPTIGQVAIS